MSLAVLADHMASKGRGPDSMLIHMSPREVQGLQALAMANGGSLTVNPDTGLPEAGFLDKLLPTIFGVGLSMMGVPPHVAAMIVGGAQTVRTGDLGKGLQAGLGAYGGAGIGANMAAAGSSALTADANLLAAQQAAEFSGLESMAGAFGEAGATAGADAVGQVAADQVATGAVEASPFDKISRGFDAVKANPMQFAKDNFKYLGAAAGPILADQAVTDKGPQTVTKRGMIRPSSYDPYSGIFTAGTPYEATPTKMAAGGGLMSMDNGGYDPGKLNFSGGGEPVVRMAGGTPPAMLSDEALYQQTGSWEAAAAARDAQNDAMNQYTWSQQAAPNAGSLVNDSQIFNYFATPTPERTDAQIAADMQTYNVSAADIARATGTQGRQGEYEGRFVNSILQPGITASNFNAYTADVGLTGQNLANALANSGLSQSAQYALTHSLNDAGGVKDTGFYDLFGYKAGNLPGDVGGIKGLHDNIKYAAAGLQGQMAAGKLTGKEARAAATTEMGRIGVSAADVKAATGKTIAELFPDTVTKLPPVVTPPVVPSGYYGNDTGNPLTRTPGDITTNPDGSVTVHPNIPGRPDGGFPGMGAVRDAYTAGGGSLGYLSPTYTKQQFKELYEDKLTGGSKQSYDYLRGKTPYDPTPYTPTGELMKPYWESVGGMPENRKVKRYIYEPGSGGKRGRYVENPDYVKPKYVRDGERAAALADESKEPTESPGAGKKWTWNSTDKKWEAKPISATSDAGGTSTNDRESGGAAAGGLMALAGGGTARDGIHQISVGTNTVNQAINTATNALGGVSGGGGSGFGFDDIFGSGGSGYGGNNSTSTLFSGGAGGGSYTPTNGGFGGKPPPVFDSTNTDYTRVPGTDNGLMPDYNPFSDGLAIDYSPFSEEGRRKREEMVTRGRLGGVKTGVGPTFVGDYDRGSSYNSTTNEDMMGGRRGPMPGSPYNSTNMPDLMQQFNKLFGNGAPAGLDDSDMGRIGMLTQQQNAAERASYANANPASMSDLARQLGIGMANGGMTGYAAGGQFDLGGYSDGGRLLRGPGDGVSDSIPATIGNKRPARLADGEFVIPARIVSELGNGSTEAGARKLYAMMDRVQAARKGSIGKGKVAKNSRADKYLPA